MTFLENRKNAELIHYQGVPGKKELSSKANVAAWERLQYGMFIHWGLYSELGGEYNGEPVKIGYSEQIQMWGRIPEEDYIKVAEDFSAENFNPEEIVTLAKDAGMKYIVITSKHHDGFSMFDTATSDYNIVKKTPFGKDPLKLLADECRRQGLKFGVYFSLIDWHQGHEFDDNNNNTIPQSMEDLIEGQLRELMTNYGEIAEVWFDMSSPNEEQSVKFSKLVHDLQPNAAVNGRIWNNYGDFRTLADNQVPSETLDSAWQTPASIYKATWGYRKWQDRSDFDGKVRDLVIGLTSVRARGGNYLLNIGPRGDGSIVEFEADVLRAMGQWLDRHPHAVLGASGTEFGGQPWGEVTVNGQDIYLHVTNWPENQELVLKGLASEVIKVTEDGETTELTFNHENNDLVLTLPKSPADKVLPVIKVELKEELSIIPVNTILPADDFTFDITENDIVFGRSYADEGNYNSLVLTTVKLTAYLANQKAGKAELEVEADLLHPETTYRVQVGAESKVVTGEALVGTKVGSFNVKANEVVPVIITLAEPSHENEDLGLTFKSATVKVNAE